MSNVVTRDRSKNNDPKPKLAKLAAWVEKQGGINATCPRCQMSLMYNPEGELGTAGNISRHFEKKCLPMTCSVCEEHVDLCGCINGPHEAPCTNDNNCICERGGSKETAQSNDTWDCGLCFAKLPKAAVNTAAANRIVQHFLSHYGSVTVGESEPASGSN